MDIEKLLNDIKGSENLQKELQTKSKDEFEAFLKEKGCDVTVEEFVKHCVPGNGNELDDKILESVSGGSFADTMKEFWIWLKTEN